jgi:hypothetical protein
MKAKHIYLIETGNGAAGADGVRYVSLNHEKAVDFAKKFVKQLNRKRKRELLSSPPLKRVLLSGDEGVLGEKITDRWASGVRNVEIIEYQLDKEYNPVWLR